MAEPINDLKAGELCKFMYEKTPDDQSDRVVVPTFVPNENIKAIDVTSMSPEERDQFLTRWREYSEYKEQHMKNMASFEDFVAQTAPDEEYDLKWRSFNINKIFFDIPPVEEPDE